MPRIIPRRFTLPRLMVLGLRVHGGNIDYRGNDKDAGRNGVYRLHGFRGYP